MDHADVAQQAEPARRDEIIPGWVLYTDTHPGGVPSRFGDFPEYLIRDTPENRVRITKVQSSFATGWTMLAIVGVMVALFTPGTVQLAIYLGSMLEHAGEGSMAQGADPAVLVIFGHVVCALSIVVAIVSCVGALITRPRRRALFDELVYGEDAQRLFVTARLGLYDTKEAAGTEDGKRLAATVADAASKGVADSVLAKVYTRKEDARREERSAVIESFFHE